MAYESLELFITIQVDNLVYCNRSQGVESTVKKVFSFFCDLFSSVGLCGQQVSKNVSKLGDWSKWLTIRKNACKFKHLGRK